MQILIQRTGTQNEQWLIYCKDLKSMQKTSKQLWGSNRQTSLCCYYRDEKLAANERTRAMSGQRLVKQQNVSCKHYDDTLMQHSVAIRWHVCAFINSLSKHSRGKQLSHTACRPTPAPVWTALCSRNKCLSGKNLYNSKQKYRFYS